ncbi:NAD-dependent epimerase/dehydratase family protein [Kitasatospora sp. NPDC098652]|uniref:NAD-dependent epimerase/dehydratase family protein n=1 Tax=Kitasatospora sp. NPDC098652 TaxID=3364095 RepID=UPI00382CA88F
MWPRSPVLLVTGGGGVLGSVLRPALRETYALRVADRAAPQPSWTDEILVGDLTDPGFAAEAVDGVHAVLHLAAHASPRATWSEVAPNIAMTDNILTAAADSGVRQVVLASSNHAAGLDFRLGAHPVDPGEAATSCCPYGAAKLAEEALGQQHALRHGAVVVSLRFGLVGWPLEERDYNAMWLSDRDARALVLAALRATRPGVHFGVSRHAEQYWSLAGARADLGYAPADDLPPGARDLPWAADPPCLMFDPDVRPGPPTDRTP